MTHPPHGRRPLGRPARVLAAASAVTLAALMLTSSPAIAAAPTGGYVALGDSYTAGPLIPSQVDLNCLRSDHNYPSLVKAAIGSSSFADVSCSGATTDDILNPGTGELGGAVPAELDAVTSSTALVTVGMSGNDIDFTDIIITCAEDSLTSPLGTPCTDEYDSGGNDQLLARINATAPKLANVLQRIHAKAPGARVAVVGYPDLLPDSGRGCWPAVPISYGDVPYLRTVEHNLNAMMQSVAQANGATFVDTYTPTIGHDACKSSGTRWVEGLIPGTSAAPFHPNALGEAAMAAAVEAAL
jgi:lysophospholipase L1-like esterase